MSPLRNRIAYLQRVLAVYLFSGRGPLRFWYETPELNERAFDSPELGEYYMTFRGKAVYPGPFDAAGIPLLDYRGDIGCQYNPIAVAQYGLACYNKYRWDSDADRRASFLRAADWLVENLETNEGGLRVWNHHFDWPYRQILRAPWYSGLAQGQGVSVLVRAAIETGQNRYGAAARAVFDSFLADTRHGGVVVRDNTGSLWIEEYVVTPPSHILNGFIWALWGVRDFAVWAKEPRAEEIVESGLDTLERHLPRYDTGTWSLYELSDVGPPMLASPYYHRLHVVQLRVLYRLSSRRIFAGTAARWSDYARKRTLRMLALARKGWFKLRYY